MNSREERRRRMEETVTQGGQKNTSPESLATKPCRGQYLSDLGSVATCQSLWSLVCSHHKSLAMTISVVS